MGEKKVTKFGWFMILLYWLIFFVLVFWAYNFNIEIKMVLLIGIGIEFIPTLLFLMFGTRENK